MVEAGAQGSDAGLEQALLVLRGVVLEVLRQVAVLARRFDCENDGCSLRPLELGELGRKGVALPRGQMVDSLLAHGRSIWARRGGRAAGAVAVAARRAGIVRGMSNLVRPGKMHADEVDSDVSLVRRLLMAQFPHVPREAVLKEDLLRTGASFDEEIGRASCRERV